MSLIDDLKGAVSAIESFGQHLPAEVQPAFNDTVEGLKAAANDAAQAGVLAADTQINKVPILGPELRALFNAWADGVIKQLQDAKLS